MSSPQFNDLFKQDTLLTKDSKYHWVKVSVDNLLVKHIDWHLHLYPSQNNEVYIITDSSIVFVGKNGDYVPNSKSAFSQNPSVVPISLPAGFRTNLLIKFDTQIHQEFKSFVKVELRPEKTEMKRYARNWIILAALISVLISLGFFMLFQYILFRDKSFIYFFLSFFSLALYFLAFERVGYSVFKSDLFTRFTGNYIALLCTFFYIGFTRHFLDPERRFKEWHNLLKRFQVFYIVPLTLIILINLGVFWNFTPYVHLIHVIAFVLLLSFAFITYKNGHPLAGHYLWANAIFFFFLCLFIYFVATKPTEETFRTYFLSSSLKIGSFGQVLLFTLALSSRFAHLNRQVLENQLENERLEKEQILKIQSIITNINKDLEKKVNERTSEINHQKEELITQAENIETAYQEIATQKKIIEKAHSQITDSLFYAAMIQQAVLPKPSLISHCFSEHFTIFWPRDIVSGDFYWVTKFDNITLFAVADCTGHGVPGAFMSMLGISLLNEIVKREGITQPDAILNHLRTNLIQELQQESEGSEVRDGMDIAMCALYQEKRDAENGCYTLDFAGSHNPCYVVRYNDCDESTSETKIIENFDGGKLLYLKPDSFPISTHFKTKLFTKKTLKVHSGDMIYLTSDGVTDQLGGPMYKKFSSKRFRRLLLQMHNLNADIQKNNLEQEILDWMNYPDPVTESPSDQIDDFCVLGVRIK